MPNYETVLGSSKIKEVRDYSYGNGFSSRSDVIPYLRHGRVWKFLINGFGKSKPLLDRSDSRDKPSEEKQGDRISNLSHYIHQKNLTKKSIYIFYRSTYDPMSPLRERRSNILSFNLVHMHYIFLWVANIM